jgi:hypothetical protein
MLRELEARRNRNWCTRGRAQSNQGEALDDRGCSPYGSEATRITSLIAADGNRKLGVGGGQILIQ